MDDEQKLEKRFKKYCEKAKKINNISNEDKLFLYANYKQYLFGNNNNEKPFILDRVEMAKWKSWDSIRDTPKDVAIKNYIKKVKDILELNNKEI
jgi:diazepam-binding inhibitor (GABA receptor modulating acyl-CoA-binding protein)